MVTETTGEGLNTGTDILGLTKSSEMPLYTKVLIGLTGVLVLIIFAMLAALTVSLTGSALEGGLSYFMVIFAFSLALLPKLSIGLALVVVVLVVDYLVRFKKDKRSLTFGQLLIWAISGTIICFLLFGLLGLYRTFQHFLG